MKFEIYADGCLKKESTLKDLEDSLVIDFYEGGSAEAFIDGKKQAFQVVDFFFKPISKESQEKPFIMAAEVQWIDLYPYKVQFVNEADSQTLSCNCLRQATNELARLLKKEFMKSNEWPKAFKILNVLENTYVPLAISAKIKDGVISSAFGFDVEALWHYDG